MTNVHYIVNDKGSKTSNEQLTGIWNFSNGLGDLNQALYLSFNSVASAVNYVQLGNAATGNNVVWKATGSDSNVNLEFQGKGSGFIILPNGSQLKTNAAPVNQQDIANKKYVDDIAAAGPVATTSSTGSVQLNTQSSLDAGTGSTGGKPLVPTADILQVTLQKGAYSFGATAGGTTVYTLALTPALIAYVTGQKFYILMNATNTGASTLNVNGLGAKSIKKFSGTDVEAGDLLINTIVELIYDGTNLLILGMTTPFSFLTTKGDLIVTKSGGVVTRLAAGANNQVPLYDSTQPGGLRAGSVPLNSTNFNPVNATYAGNQVSGSQTIAHGMAKTPSGVLVSASYSDNGMNPFLTLSKGFYNGSTTVSQQSTMNTVGGGFISSSNNNNTNLIQVFGGGGSGDQAAVVASIDATNLILNWTRTGGLTNSGIALTFIFFG
jgi:hypothetical protein